MTTPLDKSSGFSRKENALPERKDMEKPNCFGQWWEAIPGPVGDSCRQCIIKDACLSVFAKDTLPSARESLGAHTLESLALYLEVDEQAVLAAMAYMACTQKPKRPKQTPVLAETDTTVDDVEEPLVIGKSHIKKKKEKKGWGEHTHRSRWERERKRHPLIAELEPGAKLEAKYKKLTCVALVVDGGYEYGQETFPTLSALTRHIVGISRNAVKFWKLG